MKLLKILLILIFSISIFWILYMKLNESTCTTSKGYCVNRMLY